MNIWIIRNRRHQAAYFQPLIVLIQLVILRFLNILMRREHHRNCRLCGEVDSYMSDEKGLCCTDVIKTLFHCSWKIHFPAGCHVGINMSISSYTGGTEMYVPSTLWRTSDRHTRVYTTCLHVSKKNVEMIWVWFLWVGSNKERKIETISTLVTSFGEWCTSGIATPIEEEYREPWR